MTRMNRETLVCSPSCSSPKTIRVRTFLSPPPLPPPLLAEDESETATAARHVARPPFSFLQIVLLKEDGGEPDGAAPRSFFPLFFSFSGPFKRKRAVSSSSSSLHQIALKIYQVDPLSPPPVFFLFFFLSVFFRKMDERLLSSLSGFPPLFYAEGKDTDLLFSFFFHAPPGSRYSATTPPFPLSSFPVLPPIPVAMLPCPLSTCQRRQNRRFLFFFFVFLF